MATESTTYNVKGMSCEHCAKAITQEVTAVDGVTGVSVDVAGGTVTVTGSNVDPAKVVAAVDEAGYEVVTDN